MSVPRRHVHLSLFFFLMIRRPPRSTLFPYTTLFRSHAITSPPLVYKNLVVTGFAGGEYGVRGAVQAYRQDSGELAWKTYTIPGPGEPGNERSEERRVGKECRSRWSPYH